MRDINSLPLWQGSSARVLPEISRLQRQVGRHDRRVKVLSLQHRIDGKVAQLLLLLLEVVFPAKRVSQCFAEYFEVVSLAGGGAVLLHGVIGFVALRGQTHEEALLAQVEVEAFGAVVPGKSIIIF